MKASMMIGLAALPVALLAVAPLGDAKDSDIPAATQTGAPKDCIGITSFRETRIRDDRTIDFIGNGKQVWRVTMPNACPDLKSENRFTYETSLSQLCSTDIIYPLQDWGGTLRRGAGCGLSQFVPVSLAKKN